MNRATNRQDPAAGGTPMPVPVHTSRAPSRDRRRLRGRNEEVPPIRDPLGEEERVADSPARKRYPTRRMAVLCLLLAAGATAVLWPAVRSVGEWAGSSGTFGELAGDALLGGGLPPTNLTPADPETDETETGAISETDEIDRGTADADTMGESEPIPDPPESETGIGGGSGPDRETAPNMETHPSTSDIDRESVPATSDTEVPPASTTPAETDSSGDTDTDTTENTRPADDTAVPESTPPDTAAPETAPPVISPPESETQDEHESESEFSPAESDTTSIPDETEPPMPAGSFPIVTEDRSEPQKSVGYITNTANRLPAAIPGAGTRLWSTTGAPTVLIVHTHPFEGYHDGAYAWYDPAQGSLARTESPHDPDGVVALGARLTRALRDAGVTVIHLRVPVGEGESAGSTYDRTVEMIRYYCELYPDIGLILDLRRSAELTDAGEILRTEGTWQGETCAQVRLSVSADRPETSVARDIAVAVALRRALWAEEPTISRPVWAKSGTGIAAHQTGVVSLTVELGAAGNRFEEAARLIDPLAAVIAAMVME